MSDYECGVNGCAYRWDEMEAASKSRQAEHRYIVHGIPRPRKRKVE